MSNDIYTENKFLERKVEELTEIIINQILKKHDLASIYSFFEKEGVYLQSGEDYVIEQKSWREYAEKYLEEDEIEENEDLNYEFNPKKLYTTDNCGGEIQEYDDLEEFLATEYASQYYDDLLA
jgi:hypothetical protein